MKEIENMKEMEEVTGLYDLKDYAIVTNDRVSLYGMKGTVKKCYGAYGISFDESIDWDILYMMIQKETGCDNKPHFCENDNFVSFWELAWNYNCESEYIPMVEKITKLNDCEE